MLRRHAPIALVMAAAFCCAHAEPDTREISSAELRAEVDRHSCAYWDPQYGYSVLLLDDRCPYIATGTPLGRAVEAAVAETSDLPFLAAPTPDVEAALAAQPRRPQAAADALARATLWHDPLLAPAVLDRALVHLPAHGLRCSDCVAPPKPAPRTVSWDSFFVYLRAFVWPTQFEPDGKITVYVCSGNNGAAALPPDTTLIHTAKLAALAFIADEAVRQQIRATAEGTTSVPDVAARLADLLGGPAGRAHACAAVDRMRWFTGVTIDPC